MEFEEGDIVFCTVDRIIGTNIFVKINVQGKEIEGTITFSEIAPGRIRNIRDYVVPKKKIVCKILRISGDRIDLSLRRVTQKEQKEAKERYSEEKSYEKILYSILGDKSQPIIQKINEKDELYDFFKEAKENPKVLEQFLNEEDSKKLTDILQNQKQKKSILKKEMHITTTEPDGISLIKNLLKKIEGVEIRYISAGKYSLKTESEDIKKADHELKDTLLTIEKEAKKNKIDFSILKK